MSFKKIHQSIISDPQNAHFTQQGWKPIYTAHKSARVLIVGQAPGRLAQESNIPWNDPSGDNLRAWMGIDCEVFYDETKIALVPMDFYFPGSRDRGDVPPRKDFAEKWHPQILACMPNITLTLLIGQYAQKYYLGTRVKKSLTETVRAYHDYLPEYLPLVHPSPRNNIWHKKNPWFKKNMVPELQKQIKKILSKK